jgi:hypothetical protein
MPADRTTVLYLFPRIAAFTRTRTFIAIAAFIVGVKATAAASAQLSQYPHDDRIDAAQEMTTDCRPIMTRPSR